VDQVKDRTPGLEDKVDKLKHSDNDKGRKVQKEYTRPLEHHSKTKSINHVHRKIRGTN
jgi:hypothetical protein